MTTTRRNAIRDLSLFLAGSPFLKSQQLDLPYSPERLPGLDDLVNVFEFEPLCRQRIPKERYDFIAGGVDNEWSLRHNREAFDRITFRPRMLVDVSKMDLSTTLFGRKIEMPILIAPTAGHQAAHPDGELATVRAATQAKTLMIVSTNSSYPIDKVCAAAKEAGGEPPWFQLYPGPDLDGTWERVEKAMDAGCKVIVLTVDAGYNSHRERLLRDRLASQVPPGVPSPQSARRRAPQGPPLPYRLQATLMAQLTWKFYDDLKKFAKVPVLIKGILIPDDAKRAVEHGADGIVVSNHGGRYLEYAPATIEVLPEIVEAAGKMPVLVDSGFRRGTDILKALALGAKAVCVGRPPLWGLGAYGQPGVARVLELLQAELALAMGLSGRPNLQSIDRSLVKLG